MVHVTCVHMYVSILYAVINLLDRTCRPEAIPPFRDMSQFQARPDATRRGSWCVCASSSQIASLNLMSAPVGCRPQHDDAPVTRSLSEESNVAAAIFRERSRRSRSDTSTSRKNIKFGGVGACRSDSSTRVSEASETRDTTRRTGVSLPPDGSRRRLRQVELAL